MYRKRLLDIGIPGDINGFEYLNSAIQLYKPRQSICDLYQQLADTYGTTRTRVERGIRHAISKTGEEITSGAFIAKCKILWSEE